MPEGKISSHLIVIYEDRAHCPAEKNGLSGRQYHVSAGVLKFMSIQTEFVPRKQQSQKVYYYIEKRLE